MDIYNPATSEDFVLGLKEITLPDGVTCPYSVWLSGNYPRALDGLTRILSLDMRVMDPAWIGMKLRKLLDYPEPLGDFMAFVPGTRRQQNWPSTVAYLAQLIIHRYAMLGVLDEKGYPTREMGILESPRDDNEPKLMQGALCTECGNHTVIRKDGCDFARPAVQWGPAADSGIRAESGASSTLEKGCRSAPLFISSVPRAQARARPRPRVRLELQPCLIENRISTHPRNRVLHTHAVFPETPRPPRGAGKTSRRHSTS